jgi:predicted amidohydrolase
LAGGTGAGEAHWEVLLRARAIETQCYVVAAAQAGQHNEKRASYGHALIVDPWGKVRVVRAPAGPVRAPPGGVLCRGRMSVADKDRWAIGIW